MNHWWLIKVMAAAWVALLITGMVYRAFAADLSARSPAEQVSFRFGEWRPVAIWLYAPAYQTTYMPRLAMYSATGLRSTIGHIGK